MSICKNGNLCFRFYCLTLNNYFSNCVMVFLINCNAYANTSRDENSYFWNLDGQDWMRYVDESDLNLQSTKPVCVRRHDDEAYCFHTMKKYAKKRYFYNIWHNVLKFMLCNNSELCIALHSDRSSLKKIHLTFEKNIYIFFLRNSRRFRI